jgi:hypothetical protein
MQAAPLATVAEQPDDNLTLNVPTTNTVMVFAPLESVIGALPNVS